MKKIALAALVGLFALTLTLTSAPVASHAQTVIHIAPPAPIVENPGPPPEEGFVWINGYYRWDGDHYTWVTGHWMQAPHSGAHWVAHHWEERDGNWVLVEGHWE
jgi:hypothetical protein